MSDGPYISDHALLSFLKRAGGLDVEGVRQHLSHSLARAKKAATDLGSGDYTVKADGLVYIVIADRVVTIFPDTGAPVIRFSQGHRAERPSAPE